MPSPTTVPTDSALRIPIPSSSRSHPQRPPVSSPTQPDRRNPYDGVELTDFAYQGGHRQSIDDRKSEEIEQESLLSSDEEHGYPMGSRRKSKSPNPRASLSSDTRSQNGRTTGTMNSGIEHRRKHASHESLSTSSQASHLMSRESFTLDDPVNITEPEATSKGFFELSIKDRRNFLLLVLLYFLQGVPMGLAGGSVPFLLKSHLSYGQIGIFSLASYPYSLKLLWSPIVDAVWTPRVGRRKSWILPIQTLSGFGMIWLGGQAEGMMANASKDVWAFTSWWFFLVFMCATQDIAVDGMFSFSILLYPD